jgi:GntR family transcriptional repressor for pyruvate dehydrogenase complex
MSRLSADDLLGIMSQAGDVPDMSGDRGPMGLRRRSLSEDIVARISHLIQVGNLRAGDRLPVETKMAEALDVSRPVLREAMKMLSVMVLIRSRQGGAHVVSDLSPEQLIRPLHFLTGMEEYDPVVHYQAREVIDVQLIRLACDVAEDEEIAHIGELAEKGSGTVDDPIAFRLLDFEFHTALNAAAHNMLLLRMSQALYELGMNWRRKATQKPANLRRSVREHVEIAKSLAARDPDRAAAAQLAHIKSIEKTTIEERKREHG